MAKIPHISADDISSIAWTEIGHPPWHRRPASEQELRDLAARIKRERLTTPMVVRRLEQSLGRYKFELVAGHRRLRAIELLFDEHDSQDPVPPIPPRVPVVVLEVDEITGRLLSLVEHERNGHLSPWEWAEALASLQGPLRRAKRPLVTAAAIAKGTGLTPAVVDDYLAIARVLAPTAAMEVWQRAGLVVTPTGRPGAQQAPSLDYGRVVRLSRATLLQAAREPRAERRAEILRGGNEAAASRTDGAEGEERARRRADGIESVPGADGGEHPRHTQKRRRPQTPRRGRRNRGYQNTDADLLAEYDAHRERKGWELNITKALGSYTPAEASSILRSVMPALAVLAERAGGDAPYLLQQAGPWTFLYLLRPPETLDHTALETLARALTHSAERSGPGTGESTDG